MSQKRRQRVLMENVNQVQDSVGSLPENTEAEDNKSCTSNTSPNSMNEKRSLPKSPVKRMR